MSRSFFVVFSGMRNSQLLCSASIFRFAFIFVNVSLLSLYMCTGVFLVFYLLIMFLLCELYVFSGIVEYVFKFSLWNSQINLCFNRRDQQQNTFFLVASFSAHKTPFARTHRRHYRRTRTLNWVHVIFSRALEFTWSFHTRTVHACTLKRFLVKYSRSLCFFVVSFVFPPEKGKNRILVTKY